MRVWLIIRYLFNFNIIYRRYTLYFTFLVVLSLYVVQNRARHSPPSYDILQAESVNRGAIKEKNPPYRLPMREEYM